jgi:ADP-heptose:LPS heptosyltransferase
MSSCLVIQLARLGDLLQTKRLLLGLQAAYGPGQIHLVVDKSLSGLAQIIYPFAQIHGVHAFGGSNNYPRFMADNHPVLAALSDIGFDAVYNLNYSGLSLALSALFPTEVMHGHWQERGMARRSFWVDLAFRWTAQRRMSPVNLIDFWGLMAPWPMAATEVNPAAVPGAGGIGVVLAGRMARRSIAPDILAPLTAAHFARLGGAKITLLGGEAERPLARAFQRELPKAVQSDVCDLTAQTALTDLPEIVSGLDLLITPDTGLMHLGAHCGTPLEALFLSSAWCYETGPYGVGHTIRQAASPCAPCLESALCAHGTRCLAPFKDESLRKLMAGKPQRQPVPEQVTLIGCFDGLGMDYVPTSGQEGESGDILSAEEQAARRGLRFLLAELLQLNVKEFTAPPLSLQHALQERFFHEADWLLPAAKVF